MSELDDFKILKNQFPDAELEGSGNFVDFAVPLSEFCNVYKKDMSSVKYEAKTGEYWVDGRLWKLSSAEKYMYTSFDKKNFNPENLKTSTKKNPEDKELEELINSIDPWIEAEENIDSEVIKKVLWAIAMSKQDQLLTRVLRNLRSYQD